MRLLGKREVFQRAGGGGGSLHFFFFLAVEVARDSFGSNRMCHSGGSRILKGGGGQEEAEGVSCRSECGCGCPRAKPELPRGVWGHAPPENFENSTVKICIFYAFFFSNPRYHATYMIYAKTGNDTVTHLF